MAEKFLLEIVTPTRMVLSQEVDTVTAPGADGEFGVLREHTLFITPLKAGEFSYESDKGGERLAIGKGYAEVLPDKTTILVDSAFYPDDIDASIAADELSKAEEELGAAEKDSPEFERLTDECELARAKVSVAEKGRQ